MEFVTIIYLVLMFLALYVMALFIILTIVHHKKIFLYPPLTKHYSLSVLVPAYNEEDSIAETIQHVAELDYPKNKLEIIVVNDGSNDGTFKIAKKLEKKYSNLVVIDKKNSGKADSLNKGIEIAKGELIAVVDSDSFPSRESVKKMVGFFDNPQMGAVTSFVTVRNSGKNLLTKLQTVEYLLLGWTRKILDFIDSVFVTNGPLSIYRKEFVEKVGGFDLTTVTEDIDITWNLLDHGYKTGMCLDARVTTIVPETFKIWWNQRIRWGVGGIQAIDKYKSSFFRRGIFGVFIIPFVSLSILVSIGAFLFSFYIVGRSFFVRLLTTGYSIASQSSFIHFQEINLYPSVLFFFFIVLFASSFIYYGYILRRVEDSTGLSTRKFFRLLFYMLIYLSLYSIVWFPSVYRFLRKDFRW
tara:strand:+ start:187 stop:1419 length:1233 start_codon:yes stop_codon:yes gene_type:complete